MSELTWPRQAGPLTLRPPTVQDIEQALTWRNSQEVTRWLLLTTVEPQAYTRNWLEEDPDSIGVAAHVDGQLVGTGSLNIGDAMGQMHAGESIWRRAQGGIGYTIDPAHVGRGYATQLAWALLSIAFDDLGLHRVTAGCFADNRPSWRAMERIGMRREQHGVKDSWHAELGWLDGYTYAVLREEWVEVSPDGPGYLEPGEPISSVGPPRHVHDPATPGPRPLDRSATLRRH